MTSQKYKALPIVVDRLEKALSEEGISIKRTKVLKLTASALGYRNANELTAAAKNGLIKIPALKAVNKTIASGKNILILKDEIANALFGIEDEKVRDAQKGGRDSAAIVTPYGNLGMIQKDMLESIETSKISSCSKIHTAFIRHKYGVNDYAASSENALMSQLAEYVRENWFEVNEYGNGFDPDSASDEELVTEYFYLCENHGIEEYVEFNLTEVVSQEPMVEAIIQADEYSLEHEMDDEPILIVRTQSGEEVARIARTSDPERDIALAKQMLLALSNKNSVKANPVLLGVEAEELLQIADDIDQGVSADIWYDAHEYNDESGEEKISNTQEAMIKAAEILRKIAGK